VEFHSGGAQERADCIGRTPLSPNDLAQILRMSPQLQNSNPGTVYLVDLYSFGMVY
jgi:hypothetical protein